MLYGPAVAAGEWYRLITYGFLHANIMHIAVNMVALGQVGSIVEELVGPARTLLIYTIALVGGGLAVYHFSYDAPTVGASGAIFGLFGALVAIGMQSGHRGRALIGQTIPIIVLNLVIGFAVPHVSNADHIGGLVSGFVAALALSRGIAHESR